MGKVEVLASSIDPTATTITTRSKRTRTRSKSTLNNNESLIQPPTTTSTSTSTSTSSSSSVPELISLETQTTGSESSDDSIATCLPLDEKSIPDELLASDSSVLKKRDSLRPTLYERFTQQGIDWCRYCGTTQRAHTASFRPGPWGKKTLCNKHGCDYKGYGYSDGTPRLDLTPFLNESFTDRIRPILQDYCWNCWRDDSEEKLWMCDGCPKSWHASCWNQAKESGTLKASQPQFHVVQEKKRKSDTTGSESGKSHSNDLVVGLAKVSVMPLVEDVTTAKWTNGKIKRNVSELSTEPARKKRKGASGEAIASSSSSSNASTTSMETAVEASASSCSPLESVDGQKWYCTDACCSNHLHGKILEAPQNNVIKLPYMARLIGTFRKPIINRKPKSSNSSDSSSSTTRAPRRSTNNNSNASQKVDWDTTRIVPFGSGWGGKIELTLRREEIPTPLWAKLGDEVEPVNTKTVVKNGEEEDGGVVNLAVDAENDASLSNTKTQAGRLRSSTMQQRGPVQLNLASFASASVSSSSTTSPLSTRPSLRSSSPAGTTTTNTTTTTTPIPTHLDSPPSSPPTTTTTTTTSSTNLRTSARLKSKLIPSPPAPALSSTTTTTSRPRRTYIRELMDDESFIQRHKKYEELEKKARLIMPSAAKYYS